MPHIYLLPRVLNFHFYFLSLLSCNAICTAAPPVVTISEESIKLRPGDPFRVQCSGSDSVSGQPVPVDWSRMERDLHLSPSASVYDGWLEIASVTAPDAGRYRCVAENEAGAAAGIFELIINGMSLDV